MNLKIFILIVLVTLPLEVAFSQTTNTIDIKKLLQDLDSLNIEVVVNARAKIIQYISDIENDSYFTNQMLKMAARPQISEQQDYGRNSALEILRHTHIPEALPILVNNILHEKPAKEPGFDVFRMLDQYPSAKTILYWGTNAISATLEVLKTNSASTISDRAMSVYAQVLLLLHSMDSKKLLEFLEQEMKTADNPENLKRVSDRVSKRIAMGGWYARDMVISNFAGEGVSTNSQPTNHSASSIPNRTNLTNTQSSLNEQAPITSKIGYWIIGLLLAAIIGGVGYYLVRKK